MMTYEELFKAWKAEKDSEGLSELPEDFYREAAELVAQIRSGLKMLDMGTLRARLVKTELANVEKMLTDIFWSRVSKALEALRTTGRLDVEKLTPEERELLTPLEASFTDLKRFVEGLLRGEVRLPRTAQEASAEASGAAAGPAERVVAGEGKRPKRILVRFLADVPALVGADMRVHGPFKRGDVAFIPAENALALVRKGLAVEVELA